MRNVMVNIHEVVGIDEKRASELSEELSKAIEEARKTTMHIHHVFLLLALSKRPIREQRYLCIRYGMMVMHNQIRVVVDNIYGIQPIESNE